MRATNPSTTVMIDQYHNGVEICPHCGGEVVKPDAKHFDPSHALFFNTKWLSFDFSSKTITAAHKSCGKPIELMNWKLV